MLQFSNPKVLLAVIVLLGVALRTYHLDRNPPALNWDSVSFGYSAYSILKTGADEYGARLPVIFRGYDVYNLPLVVYTTVPFIALLGLTEIGVRAPAVLFAILTLVATYYLVVALTKRVSIALCTTLFLAISPWHVQYSREATVSMLYIFLVCLGVLLFLYSLRAPWLLTLSLVSFTLSFYTYHAAIISGFLMLATLVCMYHKHIPRTFWLPVACVVFLMSLLPLANNIRNGTARNRYNAVSILQPEVVLKDSIARLHDDRTHTDILGTLLHNRRLIYAQTFVKNYFEHWRFDYLFFDGIKSRMFRIPDMGLLYLWDIPFLLAGLFLLIRQWKTSTARLLLGWFFIAPVPSAFSLGAPNALRAVLYLPILPIMTAYGFLAFTQVMKRLPFGRPAIATVLTLLAISFYSFTHMLFVHTPKETAESWNYSVKQAVQLLPTHEQQFDHIIFTYHYKQPYMYYLFYNKIDPHWFQANWYPGEVMRRSRTVGKITYRDIVWEQDRLLLNALLIGTPDEFPSDAPGVIHTIRSLNGKPTLLFVETKANTPSATFGARRLAVPGT